jgi:hypothetical protein
MTIKQEAKWKLGLFRDPVCFQGNLNFGNWEESPLSALL